MNVGVDMAQISHIDPSAVQILAQFPRTEEVGLKGVYLLYGPRDGFEHILLELLRLSAPFRDLQRSRFLVFFFLLENPVSIQLYQLLPEQALPVIPICDGILQEETFELLDENVVEGDVAVVFVILLLELVVVGGVELDQVLA